MEDQEEWLGRLSKEEDPKHFLTPFIWEIRYKWSTMIVVTLLLCISVLSFAIRIFSFI